MKLAQEFIRLGEELAEESNSAYELWTWLPSYAVANKCHGDYAAEKRPSNRDVMLEAAMYLAHLKRPDVALTPDELHWFTTCPCGEDHFE